MSSEASSNQHLRINKWGVETVLKLLQADQRNRPQNLDSDHELLLVFSPLNVKTTDETTFDISITPPSAVPQWIQVSPIDIERGTQAQTITLQYTDSDSNSANNIITKRSGPSWAVLNASARTLTITPPARGTVSRPAAVHTVVLRVTDPAPNQENFADLTITINLAAYTYTPPPPPVDPPPTDPDPETPETNQPPTIAQVTNLTTDSGGSVGRVIHVADPDTPLENVILTKTGVGTLTRLNDKRFYEYRYSDTLPTADRAEQVHTVNLSLTDGTNTITSSFTVTVRAYQLPPPPASNVPPRLNAIATQTLNRGQTLDIPITYIDPDSPTSAITISRTGDGTIRTTGSGSTKKWFWRVTTSLVASQTYAAETKTAQISITDGEDTGNTITVTANIRAYTPPPPPQGPPTIEILSPTTNQNVYSSRSILAVRAEVLILANIRSYDGVNIPLTTNMITSITTTNPNLTLTRSHPHPSGVNKSNLTIFNNINISYFLNVGIHSSNILDDYTPNNPTLITMTITVADPISGQTATATVNFKMEAP